jgi:hypothetical protein
VGEKSVAGKQAFQDEGQSGMIVTIQPGTVAAPAIESKRFSSSNVKLLRATDQNGPT